MTAGEIEIIFSDLKKELEAKINELEINPSQLQVNIINFWQEREKDIRFLRNYYLTNMPDIHTLQEFNARITGMRARIADPKLL